ncbi:hypothetical protein IQ06DRAFT_85618 [Phaeosphaeriaceae sp. SRC1lsM3a]|nr:hypothetical protein IQ06DRAFT_85618 [Stagonospora sp. SRC1lsM3a]
MAAAISVSDLSQRRCRSSRAALRTGSPPARHVPRLDYGAHARAYVLLSRNSRDNLSTCYATYQVPNRQLYSTSRTPNRSRHGHSLLPWDRLLRRTVQPTIFLCRRFINRNTELLYCLCEVPVLAFNETRASALLEMKAGRTVRPRAHGG